MTLYSFLNPYLTVYFLNEHTHPLLKKFIDKFLSPDRKVFHGQEKSILLQRVSFIQNLRTNIHNF